MSDQNQLMEAAAEVLNRSRADASSQPMQKADASSVGGTQDLGGPTPENYKQDELLRFLPCNDQHNFHLSCIDRWLKINKKCPLCRNNIDESSII